MDQYIISEANRLKYQSGQKLDSALGIKFEELASTGIIQNFYNKTNFCHTGFSYEYQYKANFILETLDNKLIIINSSNSFRWDRTKQDFYDFQGIMQHAEISKNIISSIIVYPDEEFHTNQNLISFRESVTKKVIYCPATHILSLSELILFLENHKLSVEFDNEREQEERKGGSYYGIRGNQFEKDVVELLNSQNQLRGFKSQLQCDPLYTAVLDKILSDLRIHPNEVLLVESTNTVRKLASGGNAKTDIIINIHTIRGILVQTISVKNTTQNRVSCHDYRADDFIRVLNIQNQKLADYFDYYQQSGSNQRFESELPTGYSADEFEGLLDEYKDIFMEWALTGKHDNQNLIDPETQVSNYLLINKSGEIRFYDFESYIQDLFIKSRLTYGIPLGWTHPSKQRGSRIQLKLPILI